MEPNFYVLFLVPDALQNIKLRLTLRLNDQSDVRQNQSVEEALYSFV